MLTCLAALAVSASAFGYTPKPHQFPFQTTLIPAAACAGVGQTVTFQVTQTNTSKAAATAMVSTVPVGDSPYQFDFVSAKPAAKRLTTSYTDPAGQQYSYSVMSWHKRLKPGQSATFQIKLKMPDWNIPSPPYTDPTTGQVYAPPPPQPYPVSFSFNTEVAGDPGPGQYTGQQIAYCGLPLPAMVPGK